MRTRPIVRPYPSNSPNADEKVGPGDVCFGEKPGDPKGRDGRNADLSRGPYSGSPLLVPKTAEPASELHSAHAVEHRPGGTPPLRAMITPQRVRPSSSSECASGLMLNMHPSSSPAGTSASRGPAGAGSQQPAGHVAQDGRERVCYRLENALGLLGSSELEPRMDARDHEVEAAQDCVRVVQGPVFEDVGLCPSGC
jgi:hypothetical protein